jgi:hypothetical protein
MPLEAYIVGIHIEQGQMETLLMYSMLTCFSFLDVLISNEFCICFVKFIPLNLLSLSEYCLLV